MTSKLAILTIIFTLAVVSGGCSTAKLYTPQSLYGIEESQETQKLIQTIKEFSRSTKIYKEFTTVLDANIVFFDWKLRQAFIDEYTSSHALSAEERDKLMAREKTAHENKIEFIAAIFTSESDWNDLNKKNSIWKIYLENDKGERLTPSNVSIKKLSPAETWRFYPKITPWNIVYNINFENKSSSVITFIKNSRTIKLTITSILAKGEFLWEVSQ